MVDSGFADVREGRYATAIPYRARGYYGPREAASSTANSVCFGLAGALAYGAELLAQQMEAGGFMAAATEHPIRNTITIGIALRVIGDFLRNSGDSVFRSFVAWVVDQINKWRR